MQSYTGGCLCGKVRYRASEAPVFPHFCSCHMCQRWSGAPVMAWIDFFLEAFEFESAEENLVWYRTCETTRRGFCRSCGSGICAQDDGSELISIGVGSLDDPNSVVPESQSFPESAPVWLEVSAAQPQASESP